MLLLTPDSPALLIAVHVREQGRTDCPDKLLDYDTAIAAWLACWLCYGESTEYRIHKRMLVDSYLDPCSSAVASALVEMPTGSRTRISTVDGHVTESGEKRESAAQRRHLTRTKIFCTTFRHPLFQVFEQFPTPRRPTQSPTSTRYELFTVVYIKHQSPP